MEYYLPTYEECTAIVKKYDGVEFYESVHYVDDYKISTFNYRLVWYDDFITPLGEDSPVKAWELRGICFVFDKDGSLFKRYLLMNKFFNINQVECTQLDLLKDYRFKSVYNKADGSVINFIKLPNNRILAKTKMQTDNVQAISAQKLYEGNQNTIDLVDWCFDNDIMPIFEYVSPLNRVVLKYTRSELVLLRLRCLKTGEYLELDTYPNIDDVTTTEEITEYSNFEEILEDYKTKKGVEGCVVTLEDNPYACFVKVKTEEYFNLHQVIDGMSRENDIIKMILEETIDDFISQLDIQDDETLEMVDEIREKVTLYIDSTIHSINEEVERFKTEFDSSHKQYAMSYPKKKPQLFTLSIRVISGVDVFEVVTELLKRKTFRLEEARSFLRNGFV